MKALGTLSALAGIASPLLLATMAAIVSAQHPGYSQLKNTLSDLGAVGAPHAAWMNLLGIVPAGLLVVLSVPAVQRIFGTGGWSMAGSVFLVLGGMGLAATALSPWRGDPTDLSLLPNKMHLIFAMTGFLSIALTPLFFAFAARATAPAWFLPTLVAAILVFVLAFWPLQGEYRGAFQRAALLVFFVWLAAVSLSTLVARGDS
jgi:hypothetical protein